jgi:1,4-alpha-glucan branching enzyme
MWLNDYHIDGLRYDMTLFMHSVHGDKRDLPDGWSLTQWINREIGERFPGRIAIAEDMQNNEWLTKSPDEGGAGFHAQWDARFVHPVRSAVTLPNDQSRSVEAIAEAILSRYNGDAFRRVIYTESHDEVANGRQRVPSEVSSADPEDRYAQKRSTLAAALVFTSPGIPMLFQGQEFLQGGWFQDSEPIDWQLAQEHDGILRLYSDLIHLRLNRGGTTRGLCGQRVDVHHVDQANELVAFHRWDQGGQGDSVVIIANFSNQSLKDYHVAFPDDGNWRLRLNSDWDGYSDQFDSSEIGDVVVSDGRTRISIAPYSVLVFSQDIPDG